MQTQDLQGAYVRVRWEMGEEDRHQVDRTAILQALQGAADVQLEGRVVPLLRARSAGISRCANLADKVGAWARLSQVSPEPLVMRLGQLGHTDPQDIADALLTESGVTSNGETRAHAMAEGLRCEPLV